MTPIDALIDRFIFHRHEFPNPELILNATLGKLRRLQKGPEQLTLRVIDRTPLIEQIK